MKLCEVTPQVLDEFQEKILLEGYTTNTVMKQVQEWLGHSTFSTTADIYAHLDYKSKQGSAGVIANLLGESKLPK